MPNIRFLADRVMVIGQDGHHVNLTYPQWIYCVAMWNQFVEDIRKVQMK